MILDRVFQPILNRQRWLPQSVASFWAIGASVLCCFQVYTSWMTAEKTFSPLAYLLSLFSIILLAALVFVRIPDPKLYNTRRERMFMLRLIALGWGIGGIIGRFSVTTSDWVIIPEILMDVFLWFAFCFASCQTPPALLAKERLANTKAS